MWVSIYLAANSLEAHSLKGMLEQHNIAVELQGEGLSSVIGELPTDAVQVGLKVQAYQAELARKYLRRYEAQREVAWCCPSCGEENEGSFEICWHCGTEKS